MPKLILFNKPYGVLSQFTDTAGRPTLADYIDQKGFYPAGRLDRDSEGLMVLTNNGRLQSLIASPRHKMTKTYWVQVEGEPDADGLHALRQGIELKDGLTLPAKVALMSEPKHLWTRHPPIRQRQSISTSWLKLTIREGRNRQVRRMTAAVGCPTLRLIRYRVGSWTLDGLESGHYWTVDVE